MQPHPNLSSVWVWVFLAGGEGTLSTPIAAAAHGLRPAGKIESSLWFARSLSANGWVACAGRGLLGNQLNLRHVVGIGARKAWKVKKLAAF